MSHLNLLKVIQACTEMLDLVGVDSVQHGKRVAFLAHECCQHMGYSADKLERLFKAAMLHDCGVSSTEVHKKLVNELDWAGSDEHCEKGAELLGNTPIFADLTYLVRFHHTKWQELCQAALDDDDKIICNCIFLVDRVDALLASYGESNILLIKDVVRDRINQCRGVYFCPELVDKFMAVSKNESYWLMLNPIYIDRYINEYCDHGSSIKFDKSVLYQIAGFIGKIVDAKSLYTANHSYAVAALARFVAQKFGMDKDKCDLIEITGLLHDIGKLNIPDEILEKPEPLSQAERCMIMHHSFDSYQILSRLEGFDKISRWAAFHHETLDGKGYPFQIVGSDIPLETRIISASDVFQAFAQNRPYRDSLSSRQIMKQIQVFVEQNRLDQQVVGCIEENLEHCFTVATTESFRIGSYRSEESYM